jgi:Terminase large subunit, T4likevirus-type, N-terminal
MTPTQRFALSLDPALSFHFRGFQADHWQQEFLRSRHRRILLNCCRQAGKSCTVAALALHTALFERGSLSLVIGPSQRQSEEVLRFALEFYDAFSRPVPQKGSGSQDRLELLNGSRIVALPAREATIRGFSNVRLLVFDEAANVPDDLFDVMLPMLAVSRGRLICLSTPLGRRGFFYKFWHDTEGPWLRFQVPVSQVPRILPDVVAEAQRVHSASYYRQEYECSFEMLEGLVYPEFMDCLVDEAPPPGRERVGGMDFAITAPFAAVWGFRDPQDILWITGEHYVRGALLADIARALPRDVMWYADPAGARERKELLAAGLKVRLADNARDAGIGAVTARVRTGRLKVVRSACPNLIYEAQIYRHRVQEDGAAGGGKPFDGDDHALDALRYLILRLDRGHIAKPRSTGQPLPRGLDWRDESLWTRLG